MGAQTLVIAAPIAEMLRKSGIPRRGKPAAAEGGDRMLFAAHAIAGGTAVCITLFLVLRLPDVALENPGPYLAAAGLAIFLIIGCRSLSPRLISPRTFAPTAL